MKNWIFLGWMWMIFSNSTIAQFAINGKVIDENGVPLVGASVYLPALELGSQTDVEGHFSISSIPLGTHNVQVSFVGYQGLETLIYFDQDQSEIFELRASIYEIAPLVVRATRANERTPMTYSNLTQEELGKNNLGQDVPFLLRWTPSAVVTSDAGTGIGYTGIRIRGSDPTRINVTINGIPLNDAESHNVFWVDLPDFISSTDDIQIQRGVGTSTNGAGAFGASIHLNTSRIEREPFGRIQTTLGSFNTRKANISFGSGLLNDRFVFAGRLSTITSDGYIDRAAADLNSWYVNTSYLGDKSTVQFNAFSGHEITYQAWNGVPADFLDDDELRTFNSAGTEKPGNPHENEVDNYRQTHYQLLWNSQLSSNLNLSLAGHYTNGAGYYEQYKAEETLADYGLEGQFGLTSDLIRRRWLDNDFYGMTYSLQTVSSDGKLDFTFGGGIHFYEGRHFGEVIWARNFGDGEMGHLYYDNLGKKSDFNGYGKLNYLVREHWDLYVDLQVRSVNYHFEGYDNQLRLVDQTDQLTFFNPKVGVNRRISDQSLGYLSLAVGHKEPNRDDYVETTPDQRPLPERLYNTELGYKYESGAATLAVNLYHMYYLNQLVLNGEINDVGAYTRVNIPYSYRLGLEINGGFSMGEFWRLEGNAAFSRNKVIQHTIYEDSYDEAFNWLGQEAVVYENTNLSFSPNFVGGGNLTYKIPVKENLLEIGWLHKYVSRQFIDNTSDTNNQLDAYYVSDLQVVYNWENLIEINFLLGNIWNARYETNAWSYRYRYEGIRAIDQGFYPQAGNHFFVGVKFDL